MTTTLPSIDPQMRQLGDQPRRSIRTLTWPEQGHALLRAARRAGMCHGDTWRVRITGVNIVRLAAGIQVRFCDCTVVRRIGITQGDGKRLPETAVSLVVEGDPFEGLEGKVDLDHAILGSNGTFSVVIDGKTRVLDHVPEPA